MTRKLRVYLDTSVVNFLFAEDAPEKQGITLDFFENTVATGKIEACISDAVTEEITRTPDEDRKELLLSVLKEYAFTLLYLDEESERPGELYVRKGVVPERKIEDAYHLAIATVNELDVLVSWNFRHLANVTKERRVAGVNLEEGYLHPLRLTTPMEVMG